MASPELFGSNKDGTVNESYCTYCYPNGAFNNPDETFEEMVETCVPFMMKEGLSEAAARDHLNHHLKDLDRWKK